MRVLVLIFAALGLGEASIAINRQLQQIVRSIHDLRQEQSQKYGTLLKETRELDREYGATLNSLEDLKDEISDIKSVINEKFDRLSRESASKGDLRQEANRITQKVQINERRLLRLIEKVGQNAVRQSRIQVQPKEAVQPRQVIQPREEDPHHEKISTTLAPEPMPSKATPNSLDDPSDDQVAATEEPPRMIQHISKSDLQKMFQFQKYDHRIDVNSPWSAKRNKLEPNNAAVVYTNAFPLNTLIMFNITLNIRRATAMEVGVCLDKPDTKGSAWRGNTRGAAVWYNKGTFFNKGIKTVGWPTFASGDAVTISYYPNLGRVSFLKNKEFVGKKNFKPGVSKENFYFCVTMYEQNDRVTVSRYYTVNYSRHG